MQLPTSATMRQLAVIAVVAALFVPWPAEPVKYASAAIRFQEVGPMPDVYAFEVYDAGTGDFLFAMANSVCRPPTAEVRVDIPGRVSLLMGGTQAQANLDQGPEFPAEDRAAWWDAWRELDEGMCQEVREDPDASLQYVRSFAGHVPGLPDGATVQRERPRLLVPVSDVGPDRIREHQVRVEGGGFDVRVWSGAGPRDGFCPTDPEGGRWQLARSLDDDRSVNGSDRYFMLCVSYRYVGELPASPA